MNNKHKDEDWRYRHKRIGVKIGLRFTAALGFMLSHTMLASSVPLRSAAYRTMDEVHEAEPLRSNHVCQEIHGTTAYRVFNSYNLQKADDAVATVSAHIHKDTKVFQSTILSIEKDEELLPCLKIHS